MGYSSENWGKKNGSSRSTENLATSRRLHIGDLRTLTSLLCRDVPSNIFTLSWLARSGIQPQKNGRGGEFQGIFNGADLVAAALAIENRLLLLESHSKQSAHELGVWFRRHQIPLEHIVSGAEAVDGFWNGYSGGGDVPRARADLAQKLYRLPRQRWQAQSHASSTDPSGLRRADIGDVEAVLEASARMHLEETGIDAMTRSPHTFIRHVTQRIEFGHTFVIVDRHGELVFKAEVSAQSRYGAQISGVFTRAEKRRQGFGFRGLCALIDQLFSQGFPLVTLYVNSENIAARKLYEKVAFEPHCDYRTIFVTPR